jgi:putative ABC transport system ATP-binding protein
MGLDKAGAEILVSVITGATLPESGTVDVLGVATAAIQTSSEWMKFLQQFGLLSERSVIVDQLTVAQNLALPFTMDVEELALDVRNQVRHLGEELGLTSTDLRTPAAELSEPLRARVRLGRALALNPRVLLAEHPNAMLSADDTPAFAADLSRIISKRRLAALVITADRTFASAVAGDVLTLQPGNGAVKRTDGWRRWFS